MLLSFSVVTRRRYDSGEEKKERLGGHFRCTTEGRTKMSIIDYKIDPCWEYFVVRILNFFICFVNFWTDLFLGWNFTFGSKVRFSVNELCNGLNISHMIFRLTVGRLKMTTRSRRKSWIFFSGAITASSASDVSTTFSSATIDGCTPNTSWRTTM